MSSKTEIIRRNGKRFAIVPLNKFEQLLHDAEMLEDVRTYDAAKARHDEAFPADVAARLVKGDHPIKVFREHRGLTQEQLARSAKIARAYLAQIESGKKEGSVSVLRAIARVLKLELDDIAGVHKNGVGEMRGD